MDEFAQTKMQCTKPVESAPSRKECRFSHNLSSTPAEGDIFQGFDFASSSQLKASPESSSSVDADGSVKSESPAHTDDVDTSRDSNDDTDAASRKSCGSFSSLPSPRLKYRDVNANHGDNNNSNIPTGPKPRKHHQRHAAKSAATSSASRKNRKPSSGKGIPSSNQSRKRMKR